MPDASTLQFLFQLARGIAGQFGPNCEVVVHDLASNDPESSIVAIENGHVTGRKVGDGPSHVVLEALRRGELPLRVTHNDTKLNNVLMDRKTGEAVCVIDLDTVMPGLSVNDFGDSIRFGANHCDEDERDMNKVHFDLNLFDAYTQGFLEGADGALTPAELDYLPWGARLITLECGIRFLTDYLNVDHKTAHEEACRMEHAISDESAIKMCHMMGTPVDSDCQSCIKPCKAVSQGITNITPLNKMSQSETGRISHITSDDTDVVKKLISMGFVPGREVSIETILSDGGPRIVRMGNATMALDYRLASHIFVDTASE